MMLCELCKKDIIAKGTGSKLGCADDLIFEPRTAAISHLVIYGKLKLWGLLGKEEDFTIPWESICQIGEDVILVDIVKPMPSIKNNYLKFR